MRTYLFGLVACLLLLSCAPLRELKKSPARKVADFIAEHPELMRKDTVKIKVPFAVPEVRFKRTFYPVHDTVYLRREASALDSLIRQLQTSLDTAQATAAKAKLQQYVLSRPVLTDTLCFDTLGIRGRIYRTGPAYKLEILRAAIADTIPGRVVVPTVHPCPPAPVVPRYAWYEPAGWALPWWLWLLLGILLGMATLRLLVEIFYRTMPAA